MAQRYWTCVALIALASAASCQPLVTEVIELKWARAEDIAAFLGGTRVPSAGELHADRQAWVDGFAEHVAASLPRDVRDMRPRSYYASMAMYTPGGRAAPYSSRGDDSSHSQGMLPKGILQPPIVLPNQNAILIKGTPAAIDSLRELMKLLDRKPRMVNIQMRLVDAPVSQRGGEAADFTAEHGALAIILRRPEPGGPAYGPGLGYYRPSDRPDGGTRFLYMPERSYSRASNLTAASVTATNNHPAVITCGRLIPFVTSEVHYDDYGQRFVDHFVDAVFVGVELSVLPQINADNTITMRLRPTFIEAAGTIIGPNGIQLPITETIAGETQVTVSDGETIELAGLERRSRLMTERQAGLPGYALKEMKSHPTMLVTPTIIRQTPDVPQ